MGFKVNPDDLIKIGNINYFGIYFVFALFYLNYA